jgi:hypothetical protein
MIRNIPEVLLKKDMLRILQLISEKHRSICCQNYQIKVRMRAICHYHLRITHFISKAEISSRSQNLANYQLIKHKNPLQIS